MFYPYDPTLILIIPAVILTIYAQIKVHSTFSKYKKVGTNKAHSGESTAQIILENQGINIPIEQHQRYLSDHYDPLKRVLRLSPEVYHGHSIASIAVAAHEAGHAIQHAEKYWPITLRTAIFPITNFSSWLAPVLILIGLFINALSLIKIGIVLFSFAVFFTIVTLPVEFDASRRALALIQKNGLVTPQELPGCRKVLSAAALTYVASALTAILELVRLLLIARSRE